VITESIDLFASLPRLLPDVTIRVARIEYPQFPDVASLYWRASRDDQRLTLTIDEIPVETFMELRSDGIFSLSLKAGQAQRDDIVLALDFDRAPQGYLAEGTVDIHLPSWVGALRRTDLLPVEVQHVGGHFHGPLKLEIETDDTQQIALTADLSAENGDLLYVSEGLELRTDGASEYRLSLAYPSLAWTLVSEPFSLAIVAAGIGNIAAQIKDLDCESGIQCEMTASASMKQLRTDETRVKQLKIAAKVQASIDDSWSANGSLTALSAIEITSPDFSVASVELRDKKALRVEMDADGAIISADSASFAIKSMQAGPDLHLSAPLTLRKLRAESNGTRLKTSFEIPAEATDLSWQQSNFVAPAVQGTLELRGDSGTADVRLADAAGAIAATLKLAFGPSRMTAELTDARLDFGQAALSGRVKKWPFAWDLVAGQIEARGTFESSGTAGQQVSHGEFSVDYTDLAGSYNEMGATGVSGKADIKLDQTGTIKMGPAEVRAALIDIGVPIENLSAVLAWNSAENIALVDRLQLSVLGGTATAEPFRYDLGRESAELTLVVNSVQLGLIAEMAEFDDIAVSGAVSGTIPISVAGTAVTISGGSLASEQPGGVIRYHAGADSTDSSGLGVATRALSNMQYETLTSKVSYTNDGDLVLNMRLKGINPDYDPLQPVILNLNLENNIPQLLRSLQATRDIEEIIESQSAK
jgi:hypothetical protein